MWKLWIATYTKTSSGKHTEIHRSEPLEFNTRFDAEIYMSDFVLENTDSTLKFLGFLDSPWGDHHTVDPTLMFWNDYHLLIQ